VTWNDEANVAPLTESVTLTVKVPGFDVAPICQETEHAPSVSVTHVRSFVVCREAYVT
jgi:hypothetical protein